MNYSKKYEIALLAAFLLSIISSSTVYGQKTVTEEIALEVQNIIKLNASASPNKYLLNAQKVIEDELLRLKKVEQEKYEGWNSGAMQINLLSIEEIERNRKEQEKGEKLLLVTNRNKAQEIILSVLQDLKSTFCSENSSGIPKLHDLVNAVLVVVQQRIFPVNLQWLIAQQVTIYIVPIILDKTLEVFCDVDYPNRL